MKVSTAHRYEVRRRLEHRPEPCELFPASLKTRYCKRVITGLDAALNSQTIWCTYTQGRQITLSPSSRKSCQDVDVGAASQWPPNPHHHPRFCFLIIPNPAPGLMRMMERRRPQRDHNEFHNSNNVLSAKQGLGWTIWVVVWDVVCCISGDSDYTEMLLVRKRALHLLKKNDKRIEIVLKERVTA